MYHFGGFTFEMYHYGALIQKEARRHSATGFFLAGAGDHAESVCAACRAAELLAVLPQAECRNHPYSGKQVVCIAKQCLVRSLLYRGIRTRAAQRTNSENSA